MTLKKFFRWPAKVLGFVLTPVVFLAALFVFFWEALDRYDD